jgi:biotin carboxylase
MTMMLGESSAVSGNNERRKPVVVLIDPLSTGVMVQQRLFDLGLGVIIVWSDRSQPACRAKHFERSGHAEEDFWAIVTHGQDEGQDAMDKTIHEIIMAVQSNDLELISVVCGSEFGVLLEDKLADGLNNAIHLLSSTSTNHHFLSSGMSDANLKVDKFMQSETVRAFGLPAVRQKLARKDEDVKMFLAEQDSNFKVVVKPQTGAGSVGVTFCDSAEAVWNAYDTILAGEHKAHCGDKYRHYESMGVLLQEYLEGTEYIVNIVFHEGVPKCTAIWKYDKRPYNGAAFVCYSKQLLAVDDEPHLPEILVYTENVLASLAFRNGSVHAEIMYTEDRGPVLVEVNCRLHGGNGAWVRPAELCMGYSQLSVMMDVYLNGGKKVFDGIPAWPREVNGGCYQVKMRSAATGTLVEVIESQLDRIKALPSYLEHFFSIKSGDKVLLTVDMPSVPGEVTLVNSDKATLEADYIELNNILHEGIFKVVPDEPFFKCPVETDDVTVATVCSYSEGSTGTGGS